jgi:hypothetical protein
MNRPRTDLLDPLRDANPVDVDQLRAELSDDGLADARRQVAQIVRRGPTIRVTAPRRRKLRLAAVATLGAAGVAAVLAWLPAGEDLVTGPGALAAAATVAAEQPSTVPAPGEYSYLKLRVGSTEDAGGSDTEWWVRADQSGRMAKAMTGLGDGETPVGRGWQYTGPGSWLNDVRFGPGRFARLYAMEAPGVLDFDIETLPTEARALQATLRRALRAAAHDSDPETGFASGSIAKQAQMLTVIGQILAHPLASPRLRSVLYTVAGRLPGVKVREDVEDPVGRHGTALSFTERIGPTTNRHEVIFDPTTSETLATQLVSTEPGAPPPPSPTSGQRLKGPLPAPAPRTLRHKLAEGPPQGPPRPALTVPEPPNRGERVVMQRFSQYVVYLARGVVDSPEDRP